MTRFNLSLVLVLSVALPSRAEWPARVFAPYMYLGSGDAFKLTDCDDDCGLNYYTLAFIIARQEGRGKEGSMESLPGMAASRRTRVFTRTKSPIPCSGTSSTQRGVRPIATSTLVRAMNSGSYEVSNGILRNTLLV